MTESPIETVLKAEMNPVYDFTCLGGSTTNMCKNCNLYAREMVNKRYNKVIKALSDDDGNMNIDRAERFEKVFSEELNKRALVMVNNFVPTDQDLLLHIRKKITKEKIKAKPSRIHKKFCKYRKMKQGILFINMMGKTLKLSQQLQIVEFVDDSGILPTTNYQSSRSL